MSKKLQLTQRKILSKIRANLSHFIVKKLFALVVANPVFFAINRHLDKDDVADSWDLEAIQAIKQGTVPLTIHTSGGVFKGK